MSIGHYCQYTCKVVVMLRNMSHKKDYRQVYNISRTLGNNIVDHSDVVGVSPVGAAPTAS